MSHFVPKSGHLQSPPPFLQSYILYNTAPAVQMSGVPMSAVQIYPPPPKVITTRLFKIIIYTSATHEERITDIANKWAVI